MKPFIALLLASLLAHADTVIEGHVELPKAKAAPVMAKRYEIVTKGGVLSTNPPVAIIYLEGAFTKPAGQPLRQMVQKDLVFQPSLLAVQTGTRVEFPNRDDTYHSVFSFSPAKRFDLGRHRPEDTPVPSQLFDKAGLITLRCDIHEHMRGIILVLDTPHFTPPAYEVCVYSLAEAQQRRQQLRRQILGTAALILLGAAVASHLIAGRLAVPVERLAVDSARNALQREEAQAALEQTGVELQRSMRFSADTSHQLKTPITVLRAGLEELQQMPGVTREMRDEIVELIFQTTKLSSMIHDLLLLSRLDAGGLQLQMADVDLTLFIDSLADDLSAVPGAADFEVKVEVPRDVHILGEKRYLSMILQNLLENAWKYNVPHGTISMRAQAVGELLVLRIGNTGPGIPLEAQDRGIRGSPYCSMPNSARTSISLPKAGSIAASTRVTGPWKRGWKNTRRAGRLGTTVASICRPAASPLWWATMSSATSRGRIPSSTHR